MHHKNVPDNKAEVLNTECNSCRYTTKDGTTNRDEFVIAGDDWCWHLALQTTESLLDLD